MDSDSEKTPPKLPEDDNAFLESLMAREQLPPSSSDDSPEPPSGSKKQIKKQDVSIERGDRDKARKCLFPLSSRDVSPRPLAEAECARRGPCTPKGRDPELLELHTHLQGIFKNRTVEDVNREAREQRKKNEQKQWMKKGNPNGKKNGNPNGNKNGNQSDSEDNSEEK